MGGCHSGNIRYEGFRESLIAKYLKESEKPVFFEKCKIHQIDRGSSAKLHLSNNIVFFLVLAGEVEVFIQKDKRHTTLTTYQSGETIVLLPGIPYEDGTVKCGKISLNYAFKSGAMGGELLYMDRPTMAQFLSTRPHLVRLRVLSNINKDLISMFLMLPGFKSITLEQMYFMFCCMKIVRFNAGQVITLNAADDTQRNTHGSTSSSKKSTSSRSKHRIPSSSSVVRSRGATLLSTNPASRQLLEELSRPIVHAQTIALLMKGSCAFLPNITDLMQMIASVVVVQSKDAKEKASHAVETIELQGSLKDNQVFPGSVIGYENFFIENNPLQPDSLVALEDGLLGYFSLESFRVMFASDAKLRRELRCNFNRRIMDNIRSNVPLLGDLDEDIYSAWCSKITLRGIQPGDFICKYGQESRYAYIVVHGLVQETDNPSPSDGSSPISGEASLASTMNSASVSMQELAKGLSLSSSLPPLLTSAEPNLEAPVRYLAPGSLFGEVPLVTGSTYFSTVQAVVPTVLACISKHMLDLVYNENKAKLAELRIRVAGSAVELEDILQYPEANKLFFKFCEKEMSTENVTFYNAVTRYEEMFERMNYYIMHSVPIGLWSKIVEFNESAEENGTLSAVERGVRGRGGDGSLLLSAQTGDEDDAPVDPSRPLDTTDVAPPPTESTAGNESLSVAALAAEGERETEASALKLVAAKRWADTHEENEKPQGIVLSLTLADGDAPSAQDAERGPNTQAGVEGYTITAAGMASNSLPPTSAMMMVMNSRSSRSESMSGTWAQLSPSPSSSALVSTGAVHGPSAVAVEKRSVFQQNLLHASFQAQLPQRPVGCTGLAEVDTEGLAHAFRPGVDLEVSPTTDAQRKTLRLCEPGSEDDPRGQLAARSLSAPPLHAEDAVLDRLPDEDEDGNDDDHPINTELESLPYQPSSSVEPLAVGVGPSEKTVDLLQDRFREYSHSTLSSALGHYGRSSSGLPVLTRAESEAINSTVRYLGEDWTAMLQDVQQTLERYFRDLKEVAKSIVEKHVLPGSVCEVNLPARIRDGTLAGYQEISEQSSNRSIINLFAAMIKKYLSVDSNRISLSTHRTTSTIHFHSIFQLSKAEIFRLMQKDTFMRYKRASDFSLFLVKMKPYAPDRHVKPVDVKMRGGRIRQPNLPCTGKEGEGEGEGGEGTELQRKREESLDSFQPSFNSLAQRMGHSRRLMAGSPRHRSYLSSVSEESHQSRDMKSSRRSGGTGYMNLYVTSSMSSSAGTPSSRHISHSVRSTNVAIDAPTAEDNRRSHSAASKAVGDREVPVTPVLEGACASADEVEERHRVKGESPSGFSPFRSWFSSDRRYLRTQADVVPLS